MSAQTEPRRWHAIHAYHHERDLDPLLLNAVRPLFQQLWPVLPDRSFRPHWKLGPHLRVHVRATDREFEELVWPAAQEWIGGYLRDHPSTTVLDPAEFLPRHRELARKEKETGPLEPWPPNNTLRVEPYDPRVEALGNAEASELLARFSAAVTPLLFTMIADTPDRGSRTRLCFRLMAALCQALPPGGLARTFISLRSHSESLLTSAPEGARLRREWDRYYTGHRTSLAEELDAVLAGVDGTASPPPHLTEWVEALRTAWREAAELLERGIPPAPALTPGGLRTMEHSPLHRAIAESPAEGELREDWFTLFRVVLNCTYLTVTRLGLSPLERLSLCHLLANTAEHRYGRTAFDVIAAGDL
ncbi:thiopeptide maturation pyridine synthase [Halostreptopolyspora alba]|uniref:Thiopeptide-type bacteriocin biosynthesis domain-containing protein n=1 Tax=Halostreptopolyspora alba TaxID=2487137 RepID=A0A3N0EDU1_9ACTN|nr:hypothetical protein EFW17_05550 [Nocardiopsaceae bacterium YIM 96095]